MIAVTRLDGTRLLINDDLIESVEQTPDTMLTLTNGNKLIVRDTPEQLVQQVIAFKRTVLRTEAPREVLHVLGPAPETWTRP